MSVTYPADPTKPYGDRMEAPDAALLPEEPFVPVYARRGKARGGQGKIKTWMILVPVGLLTLAGIGAMMAMNGDEDGLAAPAEPARTLSALPTVPTDPAVAPLTSAATPVPVIAAPSAREAAPPRRIAPATSRRAATPPPAPVATARVEIPAPMAPTGPQPYAPAPAEPSTSTLNTAPASPAPAPPPPVVTVEPVD